MCGCVCGGDGAYSTAALQTMHPATADVLADADPNGQQSSWYSGMFRLSTLQGGKRLFIPVAFESRFQLWVFLDATIFYVVEDFEPAPTRETGKKMCLRTHDHPAKI